MWQFFVLLCKCQIVDILGRDDEVLVVALVVDLGLDSLAASHLDGVIVVACLVVARNFEHLFLRRDYGQA